MRSFWNCAAVTPSEIIIENKMFKVVQGRKWGYMNMVVELNY